jgi:hypothetical protein
MLSLLVVFPFLTIFSLAHLARGESQHRPQWCFDKDPVMGERMVYVQKPEVQHQDWEPHVDP